MTMYFSNAYIPLLLFVLKASLAATVVVAPLRLPDINIKSSNTSNTTQELQESLQLLYSNDTLTRYVKVAEAGAETI